MADDQVEMQENLQKIFQENTRLLQVQNQLYQSQHDIMRKIMGLELASAAEGQQEAIDGLTGAIRSLSQETENSEGHLADQAGALHKVSTESAKANNMIGKLSSMGLKLAPIAFGFQTLAKTISFASSGLQGITKVAGTAIASLARISLSIVTLPFDMIQSFFDMAHNSGGDTGLRQLLEDIRQEFGDLKTNASRDIIDMGRSMKGTLAETGLSVYRVMGNMKERIEFVFKAAKAMGNTFDLVRGQLLHSAEAFAAYVKGLGFGEEAQKGLATQSILSGKRITELGREITTFAYGMGEAFGINGKQISRDVGEMMKDFTNFGNLSIQTLTNVSVYARRLGVEVKNLVGVIGKFDNFEDAAKGAAHLAQAFGLNIDAFEMVKAQDPAERIELLRKSFFAAGRSIESMTRQERALLAQQTGLEDQTLALVFAQKNQGVSYADIQKKSDETKKKQLTQAEAMEKLSNSIERMVKSGSQLEGGLFSVLLQGFERGIIRSGPFRKMLMDMRRMFREIYQVGREMGRAFVDAFPGVKSVLGALSDVFSRRGIGTAFKGLKNDFKNFLDGLNPNNAASKFAEFIRAVRERFLGFFAGPGSEAGKKLANGLKSILKTFTSIFTAGLRIVIPAMTNFVRQIIQFIANPQQILNQAKAQTETTKGFFINEIFLPIYDAIAATWPQLWQALKDLFSIGITKAKEWLKDFAKENWSSIASILFGPSILSTVFGASASLVTKVGGSMLAKGIAGMFGNAREAAQKGGNAAEALKSSQETLKGADGLAEGMSSGSLGKTNLGPKVALIAVNLIAVGVVVAGIMVLAKYIKNNQIGATDVALATLVFGAAALIVGAVVLLGIALGTATPVAGAAPALVPIALAIAAIGTMAVLGMLGLISVMKGSGITIEDVALVTTTMLGAAAIVAAITIAGVAMLGSAFLAAGMAGIVLGSLAIVAISYKMLDIYEAVKATFQSISVVDIVEVTMKVGITAGIIAALALFGTALLAAYPVILLAAAAMVLTSTAITRIASEMGSAITEVISYFQSIPASDQVEQRCEIALNVMRGLGIFASSVADILDNLSTFGSLTDDLREVRNLIQTITTEIRDTVTEFIRVATERIPNPSVVQGSVNVLATVLKSISSLTTVFTSMKNLDEDKISRIKSFAVDVLGKMKEIINDLGTHLQGLFAVFSQSQVQSQNPELIKAFGAILGTLLESVGNLSRSMIVLLTREGTFFKSAEQLDTVAPALGRAIQILLGTVFSPEVGFIKAFGDLAQAISSSIGALSGTDANKLQAFASIFGPMFSAIAGVGNAIGGLAPELLKGTPEEMAEKMDKMKAIIWGLTQGISSSLSTMINSLINAFKALPAADVGRLKNAIPMFTGLFDAIKSVTAAIAPFGQGNGLEGSEKAKNGLQNLAEFVAGGGWSLSNWAVAFGQLIPTVNTRLDALEAPIAGLFASIYNFKEKLVPIASIITDDFINVFDVGLKANVTHIQTTVEEFAQKISEIHSKINEVGRSVNINTALRNLGESIGTASPERLQIARGDLTINIQVNVRLNVDEIEEAIATRNEGSTFVVTKKGGARHQGAAPVSNI